MILKGLKEKSNKNYIDKCVKNRVVDSNTNKINTVGVIVDQSEFKDLNWLQSLSSTLNVNPINLKIIALVNPKQKEVNVYDLNFTKKDLGWKGTVKTDILKTFTNTDFDLLISFYKTSKLPLVFLSAITKAKFKVGVLAEEQVNDLILDIDINNTTIFETELVKYLNILNKL